VMPDSREVHASFRDRDSGYSHRTKSGESWWPYSHIRALGETEDYFVLLLDRSHGQIYDKKGFAWGAPDEFRDFIQRRTGLKVQRVRQGLAGLDRGRAGRKTRQVETKQFEKKR